MKKFLFLIIFFCGFWAYSQDDQKVQATVINAQTQQPLESVHVVNLNKVKGTITNKNGEFTLTAAVNDTLYFSYLGYKSIKVRVTNDMLKFENTKIGLTELAFALEEVTVKPYQLTGYLEIDAKNVPINDAYQYSISGLPQGYEGRSYNPSTITKVLGALFNPADFLHNIFGKKPRQMRKLRKMKQDDEIRNLLAAKFDRETLSELLQVDRIDIDEILRNCNYSKQFILTANDLQILDAISECYEEYKVLNRVN
jgi:hypothetical protein